jgi:hypothetical protein
MMCADNLSGWVQTAPMLIGIGSLRTLHSSRLQPS